MVFCGQQNGKEVQVDRSQQVKKQNTDQWIQREGIVYLVVLWLCGLKYEDMKRGFEFQEAWNPILEANPFRS